MLNFSIGSTILVDGRSCLLTHRAQSGHALYGPYESLEAGQYVVEFDVSAVADSSVPDGVCATLDVAASHGQDIIARQDLTISQLFQGDGQLRLTFELTETRTLEYRVFTSGLIELVVADQPRLSRLAPGEDAATRAARERFPDTREPRTAFFLAHLEPLRRLHASGARVELHGKDVVVSVEGISFYAREPDDLRFVDEIFFRKAYNVVLPKSAIVIDIGMNIGLVSMLFANKDAVKAVYSFEPFPSTYARAVANLSLNPRLSAKITPHNFGLAGVDEELTVLLGSHGDSGMNSIRGSHEGEPVRISVRNAATVLGPIIQKAAAAGQDVIMKIDCEGAEFAIFDVMRDAGLLGQVSAMMVEWHRVLQGRSQHDLIAPLLQHGFVTFDLTQSSGNGFFYAVRTSG